MTHHEPPPVPAASVETPRAVAVPSSQWLVGDAIRLAFFARVPGGRLDRGWGTILAVAFVSAFFPTALALLSVGLEGNFNAFFLPSAALHIALLLFAAGASAYAAGRQTDVARILLAGLLIHIVIDAVGATFALLAADIRGYGAVVMSMGWFPGAWLALAVATFVARTIEPSVRRLAIVAVSALIVAVPLTWVNLDRALWQEPYRRDDDDSGARFGVAGEEAFYRQPALLAQHLEALRPGRKGSIDVFFVGVAGYASQDVFMREVDSVARIFGDRFGAAERTIRLVNNRKTLMHTPIASRTSLRGSLKRIGEVMDKDEDVLVLFMTSHGSDDHRFALELWPMRFHPIDPSALRKLLDESGIRNRVVIVSACYSGGFLEPLRNPDTLVITASAPDRNSFGCTNEAEWTYFGKAYFDEALRSTRSFAKAFDSALAVVAARERSQGFEPSLPQMAMGAALAPRLERLELQLQAGGVQ